MLRAYAKPGCPVREPGHAIPTPGQPVRRLGMTFDYATKDYVPSGVPCQCDETAEGARELLKAIRQGAVLAADVETAAAAGVPFVELEVGEDKWARPKTAAKATEKAKG